MVRLTAEHADEWNGWLPTRGNKVSVVAEMREMVDQACRDAGRDPATLSRSVGILMSPTGVSKAHVSRLDAPITGSPAELAETLRDLAAEGIDHAQVWVYPSTPATIEAFGPVLQELDAG